MSFDKKSVLINWRYATPEEIKQYDKLGYPYDVTTLKQTFIPGKWYKNLGMSQDYYASFKELLDGRFYIEDYICKGKFSKNAGGWLQSEHAVLMTDLSEIQQFLPEGHPDKFKKEEFIDGQENITTQEQSWEAHLDGFTKQKDTTIIEDIHSIDIPLLSVKKKTQFNY